jgi:outer membrane receptor for ferrienterochelin and colicins
VVKILLALASGLLLAMPISAQQPTGVVHVMVDEVMGMVSGLLVRASGQSARTDSTGTAKLRLPTGKHVVSITQLGYKPTYLPVAVVADSTVHVRVTVEMASMQMEAVRVSATRTERLTEETPIRVEIVDEMEVDENTLMAPSGITMLLNETPGLRVQSASPTLGTGSVRILGLPGQYTVMLADGLPLYGGSSSALGPLDISPVDLQRVEIIKGAASALYGGQALGGVINLVSKPANGKNELLLNRRMFGVTDAATWLSREIDGVGGLSLLASGTVQGDADMDGDGWADQAKATRWGVRPRLTAVDGRGRSLFVTAGYGYDDRAGGDVGDSPAIGGFREGLTTRRADLGARAVLPTSDSGNVALRLALSGNRRRRLFGSGPAEDDRSTTGFVEVTRSFVAERGTSVLGTTLQLDDFANSLNGSFDHSWLTPSLFATTERDVGAVTFSLSARADQHREAGLQHTERLAALVRPAPDWSVRLSAGTGFAAPTAMTEETEAIGLRAIRPSRLQRERSVGTMIDVGGKFAGAELLVTGFSSLITKAIQLADANDGSNEGILVNASGATRNGGVEAAAIWRFDGGKFLATYGYNRGTRTDAISGKREAVPLLPRHRAGADLMFEREGRYRWGIEAIYYGEQQLDDNPYRTVSKPYVYTMAIYMRQLGPVELVANFENLLDVRQTDTDPLLRPSPTTGGRWTTDVWAPLEGFMANVAVRYRWQ